MLIWVARVAKERRLGSLVGWAALLIVGLFCRFNEAQDHEADTLLRRGAFKSIFRIAAADPPEVEAGGGIYGRLGRSELEEMLYGVLGGSRQAFRNQRRDRIYRFLDRIQLICGLKPTQREKIEQAIDIDIARTEAEISSLLSEIQDDTTPERKQAIYYSAFAELRTSEANRIDEQESIWHKVLHSTLSNEQLQLIAEDDKKSLAMQQESLRNRLVLLCQRRLGLVREERTKLHAFLRLPGNERILSIEDLQSRIASLSEDERREVLSDSLYQRWQATRLDE